MRRMFTSATLKLTTWYLIILTVISLLFSFIIFELSTSEISNRLERLQIRAEGSSRTITLPGPLTLTDVRKNQTREARTSLFFGLVYMNLAVVGIGGVGSFLLARATLRPIEEAHDAMSRFTSDASHELRTPLAVMKSELQVALRDTHMTPSEYREVMESTLEEVDKLAILSQSLLRLSRMEYELIPRTDRVDIAKTIALAAQRLAVPPERLQIEESKTSVVVDGNQSILEDLFQILLDNALKYSTPKSPIVASITSNGRTCRIALTNDGPGIPKGDLEKIFERFYRVERSRTAQPQTSGYGLGLALAHHIVALHDGSIEATSTPGKYTTMTIKLPQVRSNR